VADESICVGPNDARGSYLNIAGIISAAVVTDSEAIIPATASCREPGLRRHLPRLRASPSSGPSPEAIRLMGDKAQARVIARQAGVPVVPGSEAAAQGRRRGGGGRRQRRLSGDLQGGRPAAAGRGMRIVRSRGEVAQAFAACQAEAGAAFGSSEIYCEKFIEEAGHVEVRCWATRAACACTWASGTARCSGVTRSSSRNRRPRCCRRRRVSACTRRAWPRLPR
jgi:acetyl-CoA carboxylase biotin carboxylase subunit